MAKGAQARVAIVGEDKTAAAFRSAEGGLKKLQSVAGITRSALAGTLGGVGFAAGAAAFVGSLRGVANELDSLAKRARAAGLTVEELSGLQYVFELSGLSAEETSRTFSVLATRLVDIRRGTGRAAEAAEALGLSLQDANGNAKSSTEVFKDIADRMSRFQDGANKTALAAALFGEEMGPRLISALNLGRDGIRGYLDEAERLGITLDTEATASVERFNDQMAKLSRNADAVKRDLLLPTISLLGDVAEKYNQARAAGADFDESLRLATLTASGLRRNIENAENEAERLIARVAEMKAEIASGSDRRGLLEQQLKRDQAELARTEAQLRRLYDLRYGQFPGNPGAGQLAGAPLADAPDLVDPKQAAAAERYLDQLQSRIDKTKDLTAVEQLQADLARGSLSLTEKQADQARALATQLDALRRADDAQKDIQAKFEAAQRYTDSIQAQIAAMVELTEVEKLNGRIARGELAFKTEAARAAALAKAAELDAERKLNAEIATDEALRNAANQARRTEADQLKAVRERYLDLIDPMRQYRQQLVEIERLKDAGAVAGLSEEQARKATELVYQQAAGLRDVQLAAERAEASMRDMFAPIQAQFEDVLFSTGKLSDAFKQLSIDFAKLFVRRQLNQLVDYLSVPLASKLYGAPIDRRDSSLTPGAGASGPTIVNHIAAGVSPSQMEQASARAIRVAQGQLLDSKVRGGAFT